MFALRFLRWLGRATWEEWAAGLWAGTSPYWLGWWALTTVPLVLGLALRGSGRRLHREEWQHSHGLNERAAHRSVNLLPYPRVER